MSGSPGIGRIVPQAISGCMAAGIIVPPMSCAGITTVAVMAAIGGDLRLTKPINDKKLRVVDR